MIDNAQRNITDLASQVTSLRDVLANKQSRGAFGQGRMEAIVRDGLPNGAFEFQFTLSNRTRPDCAIFLPGDKRPLVVDAKFPLEAITALRQAQTEEERKQAAARLRQDVGKHVADIAERYLIPGETQDTALMFVPSESVYADIHDGFDDVVQKAYRSGVVLVSPSLLMLAIQVMQQILKDSRMREAAAEIRTEVGFLMDDLGRLRERVLKLQSHFGQATDDVAQILISADKVAKRGGRIEFDGIRSRRHPARARAKRRSSRRRSGGRLGLRSSGGWDWPNLRIPYSKVDRVAVREAIKFLPITSRRAPDSVVQLRKIQFASRVFLQDVFIYSPFSGHRIDYPREGG